MLKRYLAVIILMTGLCAVSLSHAAEDSGAPKLAYFTLEPDLTTNFFTKGKELGYIQVRIEIMVASNLDLPIIEKHQPLIRDTVVELMGKQTADTIRSLAGREDLRKILVKKINDLLLPETGRAIVADLLFTKYIYQ